MRMPAAIISLFVLPLAVPTTTNASIFMDSASEIRNLQMTGNSFTTELARAYRDFSLYEADEMFDWPDSDYFAEKAMKANNGQRVQPEVPEAWGIGAPHLATMNQSRVSLLQAIEEGGIELTPREAAVAQAKFDCWVEQQQEGHQPTHIAACREEYLDAMSAMQAAIVEERARLEEAQKPAPVAPVKTVEKRPLVDYTREVAREVVFFGWDVAELDTDATAKIDTLVTRLLDLQDIVLFVDGYADRSGKADYNQKLSERRAQNVRDKLLSLGLNVADVERMTIEANGEEDLPVKTPDGAREPANRRVEIVARGLGVNTE